MSKIEDIMTKHIQSKNNQIFAGKWNTGPYNEAKTISGTDIGDVGEKFIRDLFVEYGYIASQSGHDEYDILLKSKNENEIKIEIKTAKEGRQNETYQFDGVDPRHNAKFTILLGIANDNLYFNYFKDTDKRWDHSIRSWFVDNIEKTTGSKKLVRMSPNNEFSLKLTLSRSSLFLMNDSNIEEFLRNIADEVAINPIKE